MSKKGKSLMLLRVSLTLVVIGAIVVGALFGARYLIEHRTKAKRATAEVRPTLVEVMPAARRNEKVFVVGMGTVIPAEQVVVQPEIGGRIVGQNSSLMPGGRFREGEVIARIDRRDYEFALDRSEAALEQAVFNLKVEQGNAAIAEREWGLLEQDIPTTAA